MPQHCKHRRVSDGKALAIHHFHQQNMSLSHKLVIGSVMQAGIVQNTNLKAFAQSVNAEAEEHLPGLLLCPQFLPDSVQSLVQVDAQAGEHLFLCNVNGLGVSFSASIKRERRARSRVRICMLILE